MTEPDCGSDAAAMTTSARRDGDDWIIDGQKTYISNGQIADVITLFARTGEADGAKGISAFILPGNAPGLSIAERIEAIAPHPLARLKLDGVRLPALPCSAIPAKASRSRCKRSTCSGSPSVPRRSVLPTRICRGACLRDTRKLGKATLADNAVTQERLGEMAVAIDASALLIARAAWQQDKGDGDNRRAAAMAKLHATEEAQKVIDTPSSFMADLA